MLLQANAELNKSVQDSSAASYEAVLNGVKKFVHEKFEANLLPF